MNKILSLVIAMVATSFVFATAQSRPDDNDRQRWMTEMRNFKHDFLTKELDLSKEQQKDFFAAYDEMEDRINRLNIETRELEQKVMADPEASEVELDAAARTSYFLKNEESKIEIEYFDKFKDVLTPRQLIRLKNSERKFAQQLMQHHRRLKTADGPHKKH
ncbi:MAG: hypothetical protein K2I89_11075 [Muribaculaceae bacterium]|nr:hypothetical protein [Muribaculaceae bacterium]